MKCGSTSLRAGLSTHHNVFVVPEEPRFFHSERYEEVPVEEYFALFSGRSESIVGEGSGFYSWDTWCEHTAERMADDIPSAKVLYIIRHPLERIASHWSWAVADGRPWGNINNAIRERNRLVEMSLFWRQISLYREFFDDDQIQILFLEDLKSDPRFFFRTCGRFLGVDPDGFDFEMARRPKNRTEDKRTDTPLVMKLRQWSGFWTLKKLVPDPLVRLGERLLRSDGKVEPDWDPGVRRRVEERLAPDAAQILDYAERPRDFWSFDTLSLRDISEAEIDAA